MAMTPAHNPGVPCTLDLNGMFVGKSIYVSGKIHEDADRFCINLLCNDGEDIALHVNPRFGENQVVRNTRQGGWGNEERDGNFEFPFKQGHRFGIRLKCEHDGFEIQCNRIKPFAHYRHRVPYSSITQVQVSQQCDAVLVCSEIEEVNIPAQVLQGVSIPAAIPVPFYNIRTHSVVVTGKPTSDDGRFAINFKGGENIHFHFNPRMSEEQVVRNTFNQGHWGQEDRSGCTPFPFRMGVPFEVKITVHKRRFEVKINGHHEFDYPKRIKTLQQIRVISLEGDVDAEAVTFI